jgi:hypothetical protein
LNPLFEAALDIQRFCTDRGWPFCFIGGLATMRWGLPRLTRDVDLTIMAPLGDEDEIVTGLIGGFTPRIPDAGDFALQSRVVLLVASNQVPIDVALGFLEFESRSVGRASYWETEDAMLLTCSAEDLVIQKAFAGRDQDWGDIAGIVSRQHGALDGTLILEELTPLLEIKDTVADLAKLRELLHPDG